MFNDFKIPTDISPKQTLAEHYCTKNFSLRHSKEFFYNDNKIGVLINNKNTLWRMGEKNIMKLLSQLRACILFPIHTMLLLREGTGEERTRRIKNIAFPSNRFVAAYVHNIKTKNKTAELPISCSADTYIRSSRVQATFISLLKAIVIGGVC
jgi:hypothetical protein